MSWNREILLNLIYIALYLVELFDLFKSPIGLERLDGFFELTAMKACRALHTLFFGFRLGQL